MKRAAFISIITFILILVHACEAEQVTPLSCGSSSICQIQTRGTLNNSYNLPAGSMILVHATGGLQIENEVFTYNGTTWESNQNYQWTDLQHDTQITALYPVYENLLYTMDNLYTETGLEDILICQDTLPNKENIVLEFKHLFSSLTIHLEETILDELDNITLTVPYKISQIFPADGTFTFIHENHTSTQACNGTCDYSFIIPPLSECAITLTFNLKNGEIHTHNLNPYTFQSGFQYECHVVKPDIRPGIRTAEDLITFSQMINKTYQGDRTLSDFGEQVGDEMVYRLLADIVLTEEDCEQLSPIGDHEDTPFSSTFDGENHTISGLIIPDKNTYLNYAGLFGHIDNNGIVKNLHITHASSINNPQCNRVGIIAAYNGGIIDNCSVQNSTINSASSGTIGLICSLSGGKIINCYTKNNKINVSELTNAGSIVGSADGYILNCYTYNNQFFSSAKSYKTGSITGTSSYRNMLTIENSYIYHIQDSKNWGAVTGLPYQITLKNFYYNKEKKFYNTPTNSTITNANIYDDDFCINETPISNLLNEWIRDKGASSYPQHTFTLWEIADDGSPHFK